MPTDNPYSLQFCKDGNDITGDFFQDGDADEIRLWTETADLVAIAYYQDTLYYSGYQDTEEFDRHDPLFHDWRDCLLDQLDTDDEDYEQQREAIYS